MIQNSFGSLSAAGCDTSAFQYLAIDTIHESTTNPRRTFDEAKLYELAERIQHRGLIRPITVRPHEEGFEIDAGAMRHRASLPTEQFSRGVRLIAGCTDFGDSLGCCCPSKRVRSPQIARS